MHSTIAGLAPFVIALSLAAAPRTAHAAPASHAVPASHAAPASPRAIAAPAVPATATGGCTNVTVPVALGPGRPDDHVISGTLCTPESYAGGVKRVDLLAHGGTYDRTYWDWPQDPGRYSFVDKTTAEGRATFAYDRLGAGGGSRPLSTALSVPADAHVMHRLVQWLRGGDFDEVTVIGHSLGSAVAITEAAVYDDADRLVVTGVVHPPGLSAGAALVFGSFYPAVLDPKFAGRLLDPGYFTTVPGTRGIAFYHLPAADPAVIAADEKRKALMSETELAEAAVRIVAAAALNETARVRKPVMVVVGAHDQVFCGLLLDCTREGAVQANEAPYYPQAPSLTARAIPGTGHSVALHPSAGASFQLIDQWIKSH
ncbi:alpha/beta hydrolase [Spirillospora sp. NPDC047279]|uniref:alpha/beta hydrolase n=1 Tax=Spirillospora sp. NPDC047279 TaxID=3155478 RepID=UPI0033C18E8F